MSKLILTSIPDEPWPDLGGKESLVGSVSSYSDPCAKRQVLKKQHKSDVDDSSPASRIGSLFHKMCEYHFDPAAPEVVWRLPNEHEDELAEAVRLFQAFTAEIKPEMFGRVLHTEWRFPVMRDDYFSVFSRFGVPLKGIVDMVCEMSQEDCYKWADQGVMLPGPGVYLVDWKTSKRTQSPDRYSSGFQHVAYQMAYEVIAGVKPRGFIWGCVFGLKMPKVAIYVTTRPNGAEQDICLSAFKRQRRRIEASEANPFACHNSWGQVCPFLSNGICDRRDGDAHRY
ncbi:MAG: PD-(D/E)XK nuclease family protein [Cyanobacteria bacterium J06635_11]